MIFILPNAKEERDSSLFNLSLRKAKLAPPRPLLPATICAFVFYFPLQLRDLWLIETSGNTVLNLFPWPIHSPPPLHGILAIYEVGTQEVALNSTQTQRHQQLKNDLLFSVIMARFGEQEASSSSSSPTRCCYHVFLSFRGEDTWRAFTDQLYTAFVE